MISFVRGELVGKTAQSALVDVGGVGFEVNMSQNGLSLLPDVGAEVTIQTYFQVREDAMQLFGFMTEDEKWLFSELIGVTGIGPKVALASLSFFKPDVLATSIVNEDVKSVSKIPGVGKKTASRIILELKGKLEKQGLGTSGIFGSEDADEGAIVGAVGDSVLAGSALGNATDALLSMGFTQQEAELALKGANAQATESELLQYALKRLGSAGE